MSSTTDMDDFLHSFPVGTFKVRFITTNASGEKQVIIHHIDVYRNCKWVIIGGGSTGIVYQTVLYPNGLIRLLCQKIKSNKDSVIRSIKNDHEEQIKKRIDNIENISMECIGRRCAEAQIGDSPTSDEFVALRETIDNHKRDLCSIYDAKRIKMAQYMVSSTTESYEFAPGGDLQLIEGIYAVSWSTYSNVIQTKTLIKLTPIVQHFMVPVYMSNDLLWDALKALVKLYALGYYDDEE